MLKIIPFLVFLFLLSSAYGKDGAYDTITKADYIFSCMIPKGGTPVVLRECACSIDKIESILPLKKYVLAETYLSMRRTVGERSSLFKETERSKEAVSALRRAQVIAEEKCFSFHE